MWQPSLFNKLWMRQNTTVTYEPKRMSWKRYSQRGLFNTLMSLPSFLLPASCLKPKLVVLNVVDLQQKKNRWKKPVWTIEIQTIFPSLIQAHDKNLQLFPVSVTNEQKLLKDDSKDIQQKRTKIHKRGAQKSVLRTLNSITVIFSLPLPILRTLSYTKYSHYICILHVPTGATFFINFSYASGVLSVRTSPGPNFL